MNHHDKHDHHHHHHQHNHHHEDTGTTLTLKEKAVKILEHWIRHNDDHAKTYREWADKLKAENMEKAAILIEEAAGMSIRVNEKFQKAADLINKNS